jgi:serine/threonine-protein kinase
MAESSPSLGPSPGSLATLTALGALSALWAVFLWAELVVARVGGTPFCGLGRAGGCAAAWDSAFATAVHRMTGLPVAAWGLVWGLLAFALPLLALARQAQGRRVPALVSAIRLAAGAGLISVLVLLIAAAVEHAFCLGCFVTYLLAAGYGGVALFVWPQVGLPEGWRGAALLAGVILAAWALLLYPGLHTPRGVQRAGREAVASTAGPADLPEPDSDRTLAEFVASLAPDLKQTLSDSLYIYAYGGPQAPPAPSPRALWGPAGARVRITEFTDVRCEHCAELHTTLAALRDHLPPGSFSVEARQFPLAGECNPLVEQKGDPVRCTAAKARICLEAHERAFEFSGALFEKQKTLTRQSLFTLAAPYVAKAAFEACLDSPATRAKLDEDIAWAAAFEPDGTPLVLVNGRRGTSFGPFLYAMALTGGASAHPAFRSLPAPNPTAHLH